MKAKNLVFIISDEHQAGALSCAGHPIVRTPNIDRLAARGTRFTAAYTPCPICVPARASLATGRYVHDIRYWDNATTRWATTAACPAGARACKPGRARRIDRQAALRK